MTESIGKMLQTADWKKEKHVPLIECPDNLKKGEWAKVSVTIGKEIEHPNTTEHHIRWIRIYFSPQDSKFAYDVGNFEFNSHGESAKGPNNGPVYTHSSVSFMFKTSEPGTLNAISYCNIHGLWESKKEIIVS
jgi:superoxide reductase